MWDTAYTDLHPGTREVFEIGYLEAKVGESLESFLFSFFVIFPYTFKFNPFCEDELCGL